MTSRRRARPRARTTRRTPARASASRRPPTRRTATAKPRARRARAGAARRPATAARPAPPNLATHEPVAGVPNDIGLVRQHLSYNSHDIDQVRRFYTETLGFARFDLDPSSQYLWIQTGTRSSIGFSPPDPGPPEQWRPPREPMLYLIVSDVDRAHLDLTARGVTFEQGPTDMPWRHRVATLRDPEGRLVCLAQPADPDRGGFLS